MKFDSQSPSSGDCGVTAERASPNGDAQFDTEMAAPVTELRTPTGTGANRSARVRMEAGRVGGGEVQDGGGEDCASRWSAVSIIGDTTKNLSMKEGA